MKNIAISHHLPQFESERVEASNMGLMNRLVKYVRQRGECSLGEVEVQLGIPIWNLSVISDGQ